MLVYWAGSRGVCQFWEYLMARFGAMFDIILGSEDRCGSKVVGHVAYVELNIHRTGSNPKFEVLLCM
jgi:hypothetical protein